MFNSEVTLNKVILLFRVQVDLETAIEIAKHISAFD